MSYIPKSAAVKLFRSRGQKVYSSYSSATRATKRIKGRTAIMNIGSTNYIIQRV